MTTEIQPLAGHLCALQPISPRDQEQLYILETSGQMGNGWRFRGSQPSPDTYVASLYKDVLAQFIVIDKVRKEPHGIVCAYNPNPQDGYAYLAVARFNPMDRRPLVFHGLALFIDYIFGRWNLRKLYATISEYNLAILGSVKSLLDEEGRLKNHLYEGGRYWDELTYALYRETWESWRPIIMPRVLGATVFQQPSEEFVPTRLWRSLAKTDGE